MEDEDREVFDNLSLYLTSNLRFSLTPQPSIRRDARILSLTTSPGSNIPNLRRHLAAIQNTAYDGFCHNPQRSDGLNGGFSSEWLNPKNA